MTGLEVALFFVGAPTIVYIVGGLLYHLIT